MSQPTLSAARLARLHPRLAPPSIWSAAALLLALTLALLLAGTRLAQPSIRLEVGGSAPQHILRGFHERECNSAECFRWTMPDAGLFLYGFQGQPAAVELRAAAARDSSRDPASVALSQGGSPLGRFDLASSWRRYRVLVPTSPSGTTELTLQSTLYQPPGESRELGEPVSDLWVTALGPGSLAELWRRLVFLAALPLLGLLALWRLGLRPLPALLLALPLLGLALWAVLRPEPSGYLLPTVLWPWWPSLPVALLCAGPPLWRRLQATLPRLRPGWGRWGGAALALAAVLGLRAGLTPLIGLPLLLAGAALASAALAAEPACERAGPARRTEALTLVGLTAAALALRLYNLDGQPAGIWRDEARHGLLALRIWNDPSFRPVYVVQGADLPALLFYLMAPVMGSFGPHLWSARLVSALIGALTPLALWWAARPIAGPRAALLGAALLTWATWSLSMSRWAFPATLDQALELAAIGFLWRALGPTADEGRRTEDEGDATNDRRPTTDDEGTSAGEGRRTRDKAAPTLYRFIALPLAALCAGLATYAYHTGRLGPLLLGAVALLRLGADRAAWRRVAPAIALAVLVGLLTVAPLIRFIAEDYSGYNRRTGLVSITANNNRAPLDGLSGNAVSYALMWHVSGEENGRHHAPGAPMLDPLAGALFALGLALALARRTLPARALLVWLLIGLVPGLFSTNAPHAMRSLGALAPACILAGWAADRLLRWGPDSRPGLVRPLALGCGLALALSLGFNTWLYFGGMAHNPAVYTEFDPTATAIGRIARLPADSADPALRQVRVFVPKDLAGSDELRFLDYGLALATFDGRKLSAPPGPQALVLVSKDAAPERQQAALAALGPGAVEVSDVPREPDGRTPLFRAYALGPDAGRLLREAAAER